MKKALFLLAVFAVLTLIFAAAFADGPINPRWDHVQETLGYLRGQKAASNASSNIYVDIECVRTPTLSDPGEFKAIVSGGYAEDYTFEFGITDTDRDEHGYVYLSQTRTGPVFNSVQLYYTGNYLVSVYMYDAATGEYVCGRSRDFTVTGPETATIEYKASQIVAECRGEDEWHTALNLHDWLTHHAYYDHNYEYYGADIIFRGYGVCDSYSKAYKLLCEAAGIRIDRVSSDELNHAWNALMLGGKWYQTDVTWDDGDPDKQTVAVSGRESYDYFCLNDELMALDHACTDASFTPGCTSLDANYFIHENLWQDFGTAFLKDEEDNWVLDDDGDYEFDIISMFREALDNGETAVTLSWQYYLNRSDGYLYGVSDKSLYYFAYGLGTLDWTVSGEPVRVSASHEWGTDSVTLTVSVITFPLSGSWGSLTWTLDEDGLLTVSGAGEMPDFDGNNEAAWRPYADLIVQIVMEEGVSSIGSYAFAGCLSLESATVPRSVAAICAYAFDGCDSLSTVTFSGTQSEWVGIETDIGNDKLFDAELHCYPDYDASVVLFLPADLTAINGRAFADVAAEAVVIPEWVTSIAPDAFDGSAISTIYGFEGSAAEAFADAHEEILFIPIDDVWLASH